MPVLFTNNASAPLAASISSSATTIVVTTGQGALFPALSGSNYFYATLTNSSNQLEIVKVTARSSDTMTVVRGQEGTTARAYSAADRIEIRITAAGLNSMVQFDGATASSGSVAYSTGSLQSYTAAGTSGQILSSNGASAPTWVSQSSISAGSAATAADLSATLAVNKGGTGLTSPGTAGYVLTSSGGVWISAPVSGAATGGGTDQVFFLNDLTITTDYTIPSTRNAGTFGPITIDTGATVTVPDPSTWTIV